jgi:hypothetical protein
MAVSNQGFAVRELSEMAKATGGQLAAFKKGAAAFARLNAALGFQYLLAYEPSKAATDGKYRRIEVKVRRPGAVVQYRRGYFASPRAVTLDRREFITFSRIRAAASYAQPIDHIGVTLQQPDRPAAQELTVRLTVDLSRLALPVADGMRTGALDVAIYCAGPDRRIVCQSLNRVDVKMTEEAYQRVLRDGAPFEVRVPITGTPRELKAVVYDYATDLVGTAAIKLK